jgi:hypothetical protein
LDVFDEVGAQAYEIYDEAINGDEGVLETYTKIWESFNVKDFNTSKMSKSPNLSHSSPFCNISPVLSLLPRPLARACLPSLRGRLPITVAEIETPN